VDPQPPSRPSSGAAASAPAPARPYPKSFRLRTAEDFRRVRARGRRYQGAESIVRVLRTDGPAPRLGLATPRAYGSAVRRNRFRRLAREAFRALAATLGPVDCLVEPLRRGKDAPEPTLRGLAADLGSAAALAARRREP
jgi:ribonuclease P protein component